MTDFHSSDSARDAVKLTELKRYRLAAPLDLKLGGQLKDVDVAYETYGELNQDASNAIFVCHAISGDSHVTRHHDDDAPGWWEQLVGPQKAIDTNRFFVICSNVLGGCRGSTGPESTNPQTNKRYGRQFPTITVRDIVDAQYALVQSLGIKKLRAVVGGSLGGHQTMVWATRYPQMLQTAIVIASSPRLSAQALSFEVVARNAILSDSAYHTGDYYEQTTQPTTGLAIARMLGHITYLSSEAMSEKFDADRHEPRDIETTFEKRFSVSSYLAYQGQRFTERFDANSYLTLSTALSLVDFGASEEQRRQQFEAAECDWLVISFGSDWLFPPEQSRQIVAALTALDKRVSYCEIPTTAGHDGFLLPDESAAYGPLVAAKLGQCAPQEIQLNAQDAIILEMISPQASVLDLGCGDGHLLGSLQARGHQKLCGVDVKTKKLVSTAQHGVEVIDADLNHGLPEFSNQQFDQVVICSTLQMVPNVRKLLSDALRVGKEVILSFPNFAFEPLRSMLTIEGRSPRTEGDYSYAWYNTPNRRFPSLKDVMDLCDLMGLEVLEARYHRCGQSLTDEQLLDPNLHAETAVLRLKPAHSSHQ